MTREVVVDADFRFLVVVALVFLVFVVLDLVLEDFVEVLPFLFLSSGSSWDVKLTPLTPRLFPSTSLRLVIRAKLDDGLLGRIRLEEELIELLDEDYDDGCLLVADVAVRGTERCQGGISRCLPPK